MARRGARIVEQQGDRCPSGSREHDAHFNRSEINVAGSNRPSAGDASGSAPHSQTDFGGSNTRDLGAESSDAENSNTHGSISSLNPPTASAVRSLDLQFIGAHVDDEKRSHGDYPEELESPLDDQGASNNGEAAVASSSDTMIASVRMLSTAGRMPQALGDATAEATPYTQEVPNGVHAVVNPRMARNTTSRSDSSLIVDSHANYVVRRGAHSSFDTAFDVGTDYTPRSCRICCAEASD